MEGESYFYLGFGIIAIFVLAAVIQMAYIPMNPATEKTTIILQLSYNDSTQEYFSTISTNELFSEETSVISFSAVPNQTFISSEVIECEVSCKKG